MTNSTRPQSYTCIAIAFHWLVVLLIVPGFALGLYMSDLKLSPTKLQLYSYHKWIGITILALAVLRLMWRAAHPVPLMPDTTPKWQQSVATSVHVVLYVLILAIPMSGWLFSSAAGFSVKYLGLLPLPDLVPKDKFLAEQLKDLHEILAWGLAGLVGLHVLAALKHHIVDRDDVLVRMLPFLRRRAS